MAAAKTDNIDIKKPADLDDRTGVFDAGAWRYYHDFTEANAKASIANFKSQGLTIPMVSNGIVVNFWLRDDNNTWRRKDKYVGRFDTVQLLITAFSGVNPIANPDTTPDLGLIAYIGIQGSALTQYFFDANNWVQTSPSIDITNKVDKVAGKGLSTNDYSTIEQTKLSNIAAGATNNSAASQAEANAGTENTKFITSLTLKGAIINFFTYLATAAAGITTFYNLKISALAGIGNGLLGVDNNGNISLANTTFDPEVTDTDLIAAATNSTYIFDNSNPAYNAGIVNIIPANSKIFLKGYYFIQDLYMYTAIGDNVVRRTSAG